MATINHCFLNVKESYLFSDIAKRVAAFQQAHPEREVIRLGIGDVTRPLAPAIVDALRTASEEMGAAETFRGYGPEQGYGFLKKSIIEQDYAARGVVLEEDEIFVRDGAKSDCGNFGDILGTDNIVAISEPAYPVYIDTNIMAGREVRLIPCSYETGFLPVPPDYKADIVCLCSPNNPTGAVMTHQQLKAWVDYANNYHSILIFDSAYEAFIQDPTLPKTIYEVEGAKTCAIEIRSFSKTAGFTGVRCGYTVVPKALTATDMDGSEIPLNRLWNRRQTTRFNGASCIAQAGANAYYTKAGHAQCMENVAYYLENARVIQSALNELGIRTTGGENAPYVWMECPDGMTSWEFFDYLLENAGVVGTPGSGFGAAGEGWFRLTAFGNAENTKKAVERIVALLKK